MGGGFGGAAIRRTVQVEMEGGRRLTGQTDLPTLIVQSDLGQHVIVPGNIKMIRFLKPANPPTTAQDAEEMPQPVGAMRQGS